MTPVLKRWEDYPPPVRDAETGCLRWQGPIRKRDGYGRIGAKYAHVVAYEMMFGPVPAGLELDHVYEWGCRHHDCVNPAHLEAVTHAENVSRGERSRRTHCPAGHPYEGDNLFINNRNQRQCRTCMNVNQRRRRHEKQSKG